MPAYDFRSPRLYLDRPLAHGVAVALDSAQMHYLADVLRLKPGDAVLAFNGRDGEWRAIFTRPGKRDAALIPDEQVRPQTAPADLHYLFAPLKRARLDYMVQKAVEMGVSRLQPVLTQHTQAERINTERVRANAVEAAEQCGILNLPEVAAPLPLAAAISALEPQRLLVFCDEEATVGLDWLRQTEPRPEGGRPRPESAESAPATGRVNPELAVLVGPEGGFSAAERRTILARPNTRALSLGPRILRADTAAVAALALVQAALGDWR